MMTLEEIRRVLSYANTAEVSRQSGVAQRTIYEIMNNPESNPKLSTLRKLSTFLAGE